LQVNQFIYYYLETTTAVISRCRDMLLLLILRSLAFLFLSPPPSPSDDGESELPDELPPPSPEHRVIAAPSPAQLYANQEDWPGSPDHPDRQTCQLAGSVGHYRCSPCRPCRRARPSAQINISPQITLPVSATNRHGHGNIALLWEQDFDWNGGAAAAAAGHEWSQDDWEENMGAAAADNLYHYMEERNAAADENHDHGNAYRWNGADWNDEDWENQDLPLVHPVDWGDRDGSPLSIHSSLPLLESVPPTPSPSPPPLQLPFIPHGDAGPTYAVQVGPSLRLQPVGQRVTLLHQLRNVLVSEEEEEDILSRRTSPAATAVGYTGRRRSAPTAAKFAGCRRSV
jgi:hypothetical protein